LQLVPAVALASDRLITSGEGKGLNASEFLDNYDRIIAKEELEAEKVETEKSLKRKAKKEEGALAFFKHLQYVVIIRIKIKNKIIYR